jgi:HEPN domain-containing protein
MALDDQKQSALDRALLERKELIQTIKSATEKLEKVEQFLAMYRQFATGDILNTEKESLVRKHVGVTLHHAQAQFESILKALLLEYGRPMENPEIIEVLTERGLAPNSNSIQKHMYNKLWKAKKNRVVDHYPGKGYWVSSEPLSEEAGKLAEQVRLQRFRKQNEVQRAPRGQRKPRPWEGRNPTRQRQLTDEQLAIAEDWYLAGEMTRAEIAKQLGGVSLATLGYYFQGGAEGIRARRNMAPDILPKKEAVREAVRLRVLLAQRGKRSGQSSLLSDLDYESARDRLAAIERRFPELVPQE